MCGNSEFDTPVVERESRLKKGKKTSLVFYFPGLMLLSMMIVVPNGYQGIKAVLLSVTIAEILSSVMLRRTLSLHPRIIHLFLFYISLGLTYGAYGFVRGNLGALSVTKAIVLYPAIFLIIICGIKDRLSLEYVHRTLVLSACLLSIYIIATYLNANGIWPDWLYYDLSFIESNQAVAVGYLEAQGRTEMSFGSYVSLMFLQPYLFCYLITGTRRMKESRLLLFAVVITTSTALISSSTMLLLIVLIFPVITVSGAYLVGGKNRPNLSKIIRIAFILALVVGALFLVLSHYGLDLHSISERSISKFRLYVASGSNWVYNPRIGTFFALLGEWIRRPLFGFGSGAVHWGFLRSRESPWAHELQYVVYLYYWGIIGCALYAVGVYYIFRTSVKIYKRKSVYSRYAIAATIGSMALLFANATNPLLLKFDSLYSYFLVVAIVNLWLRERDMLKYSYRHSAEARSDSPGSR